MGLYLAFTLVFGVVCGFLVGRTVNADKRQAETLGAELNKTRNELADYKKQVTQHFSKTAELVNTMTSNYRSIYGHLAEGAQNLCDSDTMKLESMNSTDQLLSSISNSEAANEQSEVIVDAPDDRIH